MVTRYVSNVTLIESDIKMLSFLVMHKNNVGISFSINYLVMVMMD